MATAGLAQSTRYAHPSGSARGRPGIGYPPILFQRVPKPPGTYLAPNCFGAGASYSPRRGVVGGAVDSWCCNSIALLPMIARPFAVVLAAAVLVAGLGCISTKMPTSAVDDSTFVHTMIELQRLAEDTTLDSLMRDSTRRVILRRHGLTAGELVQAARVMAYDPDRAQRVWTAITNAGSPGVGRRRPSTPGRPPAPMHIGTPSRPPRP